MDSLRDLLKLKNPELYSAFLETWNFLENNMLPLIALNGESINSLPHLKNNENYLNGILPISEKLFDQNESLFLSPHELYAILSAVALHDIGHINKGKGHGYESNKKIIELWEKLRIPSNEL